jgi:hypothetical protein
MYSCDNIEDAWIFLKTNAEHYMEYYPIVEMGVRFKNKFKK